MLADVGLMKSVQDAAHNPKLENSNLIQMYWDSLHGLSSQNAMLLKWKYSKTDTVPRHWGTRRSENDNTPPPLDHWMDSPFMGQQVGNCNCFTSTHCASNIASNPYLFHSESIDLPIPKIQLLKIWRWKSKVNVMVEVKVQGHNLGPTSYRLASFWF